MNNKKWILRLTLFSVFTLFVFSACQERKKVVVKKKSYSQLIVDTESGTQFQLDTTQIYITAITSNNDTLWKIDPWKDNNLGEYRLKRPIIIYFMFKTDEITGRKVIAIDYNSSQFGTVELKTGQFTFLGND